MIFDRNPKKDKASLFGRPEDLASLIDKLEQIRMIGVGKGTKYKAV
jgi:hypothetical protein